MNAWGQQVRLLCLWIELSLCSWPIISSVHSKQQKNSGYVSLQAGSKDAVPDSSRAYTSSQWRLAPPAVSLLVSRSRLMYLACQTM